MSDTNKTTLLQKVLRFFLTKMIIATAVIILLVFIVEVIRSSILDKTSMNDDVKALVVAIVEAIMAVCGYIFVFKTMDKRPIDELRARLFPGYATLGFFTGMLLQSLIILIIYLEGTYQVVSENPFSILISPFAFALTAGFVAEIILIGIVFRLVEEQIGTKWSLLAFIVLFAILHVNVKGATIVSVGATAMQAGFMLPAAYVFSRNLWLPIFLHFAWDLAEPGIYGGINPSTSLTQGLLTSKIEGSRLLTGGSTGPQDSLSALLLCLGIGIIFLLLAKQKNHIRA